MKKITSSGLLILISFLFINISLGQNTKKSSDKTDDVKGNSATFEVTYVNFPDEAKNAFQYAIDLWSKNIKSPVIIRIGATWKPLSGSTFAVAVSGGYFKDFDGVPLKKTFYPVALAEKLAGKDLNSTSEPDIIIDINSNQSNYYFGIDGKPQSGKFDFVTLILHEITHGLGFFSSFTVEDNTGKWGDKSSYPHVFDRFVITTDNKSLIDTTVFTNPSAALYSAFISQNLFFNGQAALNQNGGVVPKLYSPNFFQSGSSIYHLDEDTYPAGDINALMTPLLGLEVIHNPGPLLLAIMADLGWTNTSIKHSLLSDNEDTKGPYKISSEIISDTSLVAGSAEVHYSLDGFQNEQILKMTTSAKPSEYVTDIPSPGKEATISYYISVKDAYNRTFRYPVDTYHSFKIGIDKIAPVINHTPVVSFSLTDKNFEISATVTDNTALKDVKIEYLINEVKQTDIIMTAGNDNKFSGSFDFSKAAANDIVKYKIVATDKSTNSNKSTNPETGYHTFTITSTATAYQNDFNSASNDFSGTDFSIRTEAGFDNGALHSDHPYKTTGKDEVLTNFITQLKIPVKVKEKYALMTFDEIVLAEPGEPGSVFGQNEFYDYVIVEASKDLGKTWIPLCDGYDARYKTEWLNLYNSKLVASSGHISSQAVATKEHFRYRIINLYGRNKEIKGGDEILIGFRIFSDPFSNGWGWAIDNLKIQVVRSTDIEDFTLENLINVYPNPSNGRFTLSMGTEITENYHVKIYNINGQLVFTDILKSVNNLTEKEINLQGIKNGLYVIQVIGKQNTFTKKLIINSL